MYSVYITGMQAPIIQGEMKETAEMKGLFPFEKKPLFILPLQHFSWQETLNYADRSQGEIQSSFANYNNNNKLYFVKTGLHRKQYKIQIKFEIKKYTVNLLNWNYTIQKLNKQLREIKLP